MPNYPSRDNKSPEKEETQKTSRISLYAALIASFWVVTALAHLGSAFIGSFGVLLFFCLYFLVFLPRLSRLQNKVLFQSYENDLATLNVHLHLGREEEGVSGGAGTPVWLAMYLMVMVFFFLAMSTNRAYDVSLDFPQLVQLLLFVFFGEWFHRGILLSLLRSHGREGMLLPVVSFLYAVWVVGQATTLTIFNLAVLGGFSFLLSLILTYLTLKVITTFPAIIANSVVILFIALLDLPPDKLVPYYTLVLFVSLFVFVLMQVAVKFLHEQRRAVLISRGLEHEL